MAPEVLRQFAGYFWNVPGVDRLALGLVELFLPLVGIEPAFEYDVRRIIVGDFRIRVNQSCSGIEGAVLVSGFLTGIAIMLRRELDPRRMAMLIFAGALLSWILNAARITVLVWIGVHVSPELAIDGFHSNAGWLLFVMLSVLLLWCAANLSFFQRVTGNNQFTALADARSRSVFLNDPVPAMILPFVLFLAPVLILPAITLTPDQAYPARALIGALGLAAFWRVLLRLPLQLSPFAIISGLTIAAGWIAMHTPTTVPTSEHGAFWMVARLLGTILIAPVVEELFFRGYLIQRLGGGSRPALILAIAFSTTIFAALHVNWLMAGIAGLIFAGLMLRSGRITDAIQAHIVANTAIGAFAFWTGDWTVI